MRVDKQQTGAAEVDRAADSTLVKYGIGRVSVSVAPITARAQGGLD